MNRTNKTFLSFKGTSRIATMLALITLTAFSVQAQCPVTELTSGLQRPIGITGSQKGNLLVSESGSATPNTGRITIVDPHGNRRTLLAGLPSGISFESNAASGAAGLFLRENTLYVAIGVGDSVQAGPSPGTTAPNPNPSSLLFSSVLAITFSANVENRTAGFALTAADQQALANGERVRLSDRGGDRITVDLVVNFPDFTPNPLPIFAGNVRNSNPFDLVAVGDYVYVANGGQNLVAKVDLRTGAFSTLVAFPPIPNPLPFGPPVVEAVPTGIAYSEGRLLVTLFRGFPFPPGTSVVEQIDRRTGSHAPFITGFKTAIDVDPVGDEDDDDDSVEHSRRNIDDDEDEDGEGGDTDYLVLQHASDSILTGPGLLLSFETPGGPATVIASCLNSPTSMTRHKRTNIIYVTELFTGRIVAVHVSQ